MAHPLAAAICAEALTWLGTPFHDQAALKGVGADCAGLVLGVAKALGLVAPAWRPPPYHPAWHLFESSELLADTMQQLGATPLEPTQTAPGDILLCRWRGQRAHGHCAILLPEAQVLHALVRRGVVRQPLTGRFWRGATRAMRFPLPGGTP
jgi:NlpC/P60 family putative phage cell wall peptidase